MVIRNVWPGYLAIPDNLLLRHVLLKFAIEKTEIAPFLFLWQPKKIRFLFFFISPSQGIHVQILIETNWNLEQNSFYNSLSILGKNEFTFDGFSTFSNHLNRKLLGYFGILKKFAFIVNYWRWNRHKNLVSKPPFWILFRSWKLNKFWALSVALFSTLF